MSNNNDTVPLLETSYLLFPGNYVAVSENPAAIIARYGSKNPAAVLHIDNLPSFNDDAGTVKLQSKIGHVIDKFTYSANMHFALLTTVEGVSLERIDPYKSTQDASNWHSAAQTVNFATPGYENSQYKNNKDNEDMLSLIPEVFSPDNDGHDDILQISYHAEMPGTMGNAYIYDAKGNLIKFLVKNELLALHGTYNWDGITEQNIRAPIGLYVLIFQLTEPQGNVKTYKKAFAVAGKLSE
jgi:hypothetical protein